MAEMNPVARFFVNLSSGRRDRRRWHWLAAHLPDQPRSACLEIGCGNGDFAALFIGARHPVRYVATDIDPRQLEAARRHLAPRYSGGLPDVLELDEADMLELPYPDRAFDTVFAFLAIHHASPAHGDPTHVPEALAEIDRVLRPSGVFVYEEFLHKELIRSWLRTKGYNVLADAHRWTRESVIAQRPGPPAPAAPAAPPP